MVQLYVPEAVGIESKLHNLETTRRRDNSGVGNSHKRKLTINTEQQRLDQGNKVITWAWELTQLVDRREWESTMDRQQLQQQKDGRLGLHFGCQFTNCQTIKDKYLNNEELPNLKVKDVDNIYVQETTGF
jgi:hypothetical protein